MSNFSYDLVQDRSNVPITIGFVAVLLLILALVLVSLSQFKNINISLTTLVEQTNIKLQAANSMRDAIRLRADSLKKMRLMSDPFERDDEFLKFNQYAGIFRIARENLLKLPMKPEEMVIMVKMAIASFDNAIRFINEFKKVGCSFALDDFGSGLSSFAYLKQLPVDTLKIDGIFAKNIDVEAIDYAMVKSINEIAHLYKKITVAEFVESDVIFEKLQELGVDYAQGYGISKPVRLSDIPLI